MALVNCLELDADDIRHIMEQVLLEFPVTEINVTMPDFIKALDSGHSLVQSVNNTVSTCASAVRKTGDIATCFEKATENEYIKSVSVGTIDLGTGRADVDIELKDGLFYKIIGELTGFNVSDDESMMNLLVNLSSVKKKYDKISQALENAERTGYGVVTPDIYDLKLEQPEIVRRSGAYSVRLRASAPSIHMIKANIKTEVSPMVGTEQQSEQLVQFLLGEFENDPKKIWDTNIFGKSLYELVNEGLVNKLSHIPEESRVKLSETLGRIINEGSNGLICIIL